MLSGEKDPLSLPTTNPKELGQSLLSEDVEKLEGALQKGGPGTNKRKREADLKDFLKAQVDTDAKTPEKMKARLIDDVIVTPGHSRYKMGQKIGEGDYAEVYLGKDVAASDKLVAVKVRSNNEGSPHSEAKRSTAAARSVYGYGSFYCPDRETCKQTQSEHYLILPYIQGKEPEDILGDYLSVITTRSNADSLAMYATLRVLIALAEAFQELASEIGIIHGDAHSGNIKMGLNPMTQRLEAKAIDYDRSKGVGERTEESEEAETDTPKMFAARADVDSIGLIFNDIMITLIESDMYGPDREGETDRGLLAEKFLTELDLLESLISQMSSQKLEARPDFSEVVARLTTIYQSAQSKFVREGRADFTDEPIASAPAPKKDKEFDQESAAEGEDVPLPPLIKRSSAGSAFRPK